MAAWHVSTGDVRKTTRLCGSFIRPVSVILITSSNIHPHALIPAMLNHFLPPSLCFIAVQTHTHTHTGRWKKWSAQTDSGTSSCVCLCLPTFMLPKYCIWRRGQATAWACLDHCTLAGPLFLWHPPTISQRNPLPFLPWPSAYKLPDFIAHPCSRRQSSIRLSSVWTLRPFDFRSRFFQTHRWGPVCSIIFEMRLAAFIFHLRRRVNRFE